QRTIYAVLVLAALLFIASYFVYKNRLQKLRFSNQIAKDKLDNQLKEIEFESRLTELTLASLKSQMNPHFIFNCLNSIKLYIERNDTELASLYISKFSKLVRDILDISRSEKISLAKELELIELYLAMECMRFKEKLIYTIDIDQSVDADFIEFPPMLLQPYVENAIWHGLMPKAEGGLLTISVRKTLDEKHLLIVISDNGIGREGSALLKGRRSSTHTSHGGKISDERIAMFNARYKSGIEVETDDLLNADDQAAGTMVTIKFLYHEIFESSFSGR
ncbi:MAG: sensor histidine kinase, partial [Mucilaginibacter sp.]